MSLLLLGKVFAMLIPRDIPAAPLCMNIAIINGYMSLSLLVIPTAKPSKIACTPSAIIRTKGVIFYTHVLALLNTAGYSYKFIDKPLLLSTFFNEADFTRLAARSMLLLSTNKFFSPIGDFPRSAFEPSYGFYSIKLFETLEANLS